MGRVRPDPAADLLALLVLPVCWGGCPKRHLDGTRADIDAEGRFWRANLPRMVTDGLGEQVPDGFVFSATEQFRDAS